MATRGQKRHLVSLENPGVSVPDGDGGYVEVPASLSPSTMYAEIKPATTRDMERVTAGTVISSDSLLIDMDFHPGVTTKTRLAWVDPSGRSHTASVTSVNNPGQRCRELILVAVEVVQ